MIKPKESDIVTMSHKPKCRVTHLHWCHQVPMSFTGQSKWVPLPVSPMVFVTFLSKFCHNGTKQEHGLLFGQRSAFLPCYQHDCWRDTRSKSNPYKLDCPSAGIGVIGTSQLKTIGGTKNAIWHSQTATVGAFLPKGWNHLYFRGNWFELLW